MITDNGLYTLAIFLGSLAMLLIVLYHFLEVNAMPDDEAIVAGDVVGETVMEKEKEKVGGKR